MLSLRRRDLRAAHASALTVQTLGWEAIMESDREFEHLKLEANRELEEMKLQSNRELEKLKLLFDYTKFHIGLYTTVATIFGGLIAASGNLPFKFNTTLLFAAVICICIAGWAGGTIASSIPAHGGYTEFWKSQIGPFRFKGPKAEYWTYLEHIAFWVAVLLAVGSIFVTSQPLTPGHS
jgi:hypothetical protein